MSVETTEPEVTAEAQAPEPGNVVAIRRTRDLATAIPAKLAYAKALADSGLLPAQFRKQPGNVLYAVEYGEMLGLAPMAAITGIHVIEGKPTASAGLISALVRRAGHKLRAWGDGKSATCVIVRADDPDFEFKVTWTLKRNSDDNPSAEEARLLGKDVWQKYPASMLKSRAISQCARDACEEVLFGLHYTPEEMGAVVDEEGNLLVAEVIGDGAVTDLEWFNAAMGRAPHLAALGACRDLWAESAALVGDGRCTRADAEALQDVLRKRMEVLRTQQTAPAETDQGTAEGAPGGRPQCPEGQLRDGVLFRCVKQGGHWQDPDDLLCRDEDGREWASPSIPAQEPEAVPDDDPEAAFVRSFAARTADAGEDDVRPMRAELAAAVKAKVISTDIANDLGRSLAERVAGIRKAAA